MDIKGIVRDLSIKYNTRNPFEIADKRKIIVRYELLGSIRGYYSNSHRQQVIHINQNLEGGQLLFTCSHELAHTVLHPQNNTPFLRAATMYSVDKLEVQANRFAMDLIFTDEELQPFLDRSIYDAAAYMGVSPQLAEYRMQTVVPQYIEDFGC